MLLDGSFFHSILSSSIISLWIKCYFGIKIYAVEEVPVGMYTSNRQVSLRYKIWNAHGQYKMLCTSYKKPWIR